MIENIARFALRLILVSAFVISVGYWWGFMCNAVEERRPDKYVLSILMMLVFGVVGGMSVVYLLMFFKP